MQIKTITVNEERLDNICCIIDANCSYYRAVHGAPDCDSCIKLGAKNCNYEKIKEYVKGCDK